MKLLFIFTGGTIGSTTTEEGFIAPTSNSKYNLINLYKERYGIDFQYDTVEPYEILSETLEGTHLNLLRNAISKALASSFYDGIIITHGTDTLQYTATAMEYLFDNSLIPIVFVSSNYILKDAKANGISNLRSAILFIKKHASNGVYVSYRNTSMTPLIHKPSLLCSHFQYSDSLLDIDNLFYGKIQEGEFISGAIASFHNAYNPIPSFKNFCNSPNIIILKAAPGMTYPTNLDNVTAILFDTFHSGTLNTNSDELFRFSNLANKKNIPIFLTGIEDRTAYESTKCFSEYNFIALPKASIIAMYVKLWLLISCSLTKDKLAVEMLSPISYEFVASTRVSK